jgi:hypothetical protein
MFKSALTQHTVVKTFSSREVAGQAMDRLVLAGFPIAQVLIFGEGEVQGTAFQAVAYGTVTGTAGGLKKGIVLGNVMGGMTGILLGAGLMVLPGVGQLALSSAIAFMLLSGGVCTAAGGLVGAMIGLGFTAEQAKLYDQQIANGKVLLMVEGTIAELDRARCLLHASTV